MNGEVIAARDERKQSTDDEERRKYVVMPCIRLGGLKGRSSILVQGWEIWGACRRCGDRDTKCLCEIG